MKKPSLSATESGFLVGLALFGLLVPNGIFVWALFVHPEWIRDALMNPVALVFIAEAFLLMFLFAWVLAKAGGGAKGVLFVAGSLIGGLGFSVPLALRAVFGRKHGQG